MSDSQLNSISYLRYLITTEINPDQFSYLKSLRNLLFSLLRIRITNARGVLLLGILILSFCPEISIGQSGIDAKKVLFGSKTIWIPKLKGYDYHEDSRYKDIDIYKLTKTELLKSDIINFEYLVPHSDSGFPSIQIQAFKITEGRTLTAQQFLNTKNQTIKLVEKNEYDRIATGLNSGNTNVQSSGLPHQTGYLILLNNERLLSFLLKIHEGSDLEKSDYGVISNYIYVNGTIVFVKTILVLQVTKDLLNLIKVNEEYINLVLQAN